MAYIALYREWRPQLFRDIVGQEHVTRTLQNALRTNRFAHAYLFNGPRGTGKTSAAKILAKAINCDHGPSEEPCNECPACIGITKGTIMDVMEIDAASNRGVDEIRDLRDKVKFAPTEVRYKVYIVDEVHMLTTEAFNALLKTLEEPPHHVMFILATTEPHKLPATIISRCQRFDFRRIMGRQIVDRLKYIAEQKDVQVEEEAYWLVARAAEGGMRDALSIFDQVISFGGDQVRAEDIVSMVGAVGAEVLAKIARAVTEHDAPQVLGIIGQLMDNGRDVGQLMHDIVTYFRDLLMYKTVPHLEEVQDRSNYDKDFAEAAGLFETQLLIQMIEEMTKVQNELKWQSQGRLLLEMLMVRLCHMQSFDPKDLLARIEALEGQSGGGANPAATAAGGYGVSPDLMRRIADLERKVAQGVPAAGQGYAAQGAAPGQTAGGQPMQGTPGQAAGGQPMQGAPGQAAGGQPMQGAPGQAAGGQPMQGAPGQAVGGQPVQGAPGQVPGGQPMQGAPGQAPSGQPMHATPGQPDAQPMHGAAGGQGQLPFGSQPQAPAPAKGPVPRGLNKVVTNPSPEALQHVQQFWPKVLDKIKDISRTTQALLLGGNPVAVDNGYIVVAFRYEYHAEMVMKEKNKTVVDAEFTQLMNGAPTQMYAVLEADWEKFQATFVPGGDGPPAPVAEEAPPEQEAAPEQDELVEKANSLFGAEHVQVVD